MKFLQTLFANVLGSLIAFGILLFFGFLFLIALASTADQTPPVQSGSILTIDLVGSFPETVSGDPLTQLIMGEASVGLHSMIAAIDAATTDSRIKGIWIRSNGMLSSWASLEAIRRSLEAFKASGKPILATSKNHFMMESEYYVASVADSIFLEPESIFEFNGFAMTSTFYGDLFEKLGIEAEVVRSGKYKGAVEAYTRSSMSPENREQLQALLDGVKTSFVSSVAASRNLRPEQVDLLMNRDAMFSAREALDNGLVDGLIFEDEVMDKLRLISGSDSSKTLVTVSASNYAARLKPTKSSDKIAVVHITGTMMSGAPADSPLTGGGMAGSETIAKAIQQARDRTGVRAMVVRINSPGGFAPAGDAMLREVKRTATEMPVVISMGDVAASGGYWVATGGNRIFAENNTITGSIGVFSMFLNVSGLVEDKIGITFDNVTTGPYADMFSGMRGYSEAERAILGKATDGTYQTFLEKVAKSRGMSVEAAQEIAQGRVWTGSDALRVGLVDEIGGLDAAIAYAQKAAKLDPGTVEIVRYPAPRSLLDQFMKSPAATVKILASALKSKNQLLASRRLEEVQQMVDSRGQVQALWPWNITIK
ncbi:MAG: signal peptide peptidase SppA [Bacteroidetes bacterium]|nr:signal peptide peptidase SppA [Bacteroidota bacterium]